MKGFKSGCQHKYAGGGAAKGVPGMKRRGHPVAAKKVLVSPPPLPAAGSAGVKVAMPALKGIASGAMGRGPGQVAVAQGAAPPTNLNPRKMVAARPPKFQDGGRVPTEAARAEQGYQSNLRAAIDKKMTGDTSSTASPKAKANYAEAVKLRNDAYDSSSSYSGADYSRLKALKFAAGGIVPASNVQMTSTPTMPPQAYGAQQPLIPQQNPIGSGLGKR